MVGVGTMIDGVHIIRHGKRWRVSVPNCGYPSAVLWVACVDEGLQIRVTRGANLQPTSHGLLGKFIHLTPHYNNKETFF